MLRLFSGLLFAWFYLDSALLLGLSTAAVILLELNSDFQYSTVSTVLQCVLGPLCGLLVRLTQQMPVLSWSRFSLYVETWPRQLLVFGLMALTLLPYDRDLVDERPSAIPLGIIISALLTMAMAWLLALSRHSQRQEVQRPQEEWYRFDQYMERVDIKLASVQWVVASVDLWAFELRPLWYCAVLYGIVLGVLIVAWLKDQLCIITLPYQYEHHKRF